MLNPFASYSDQVPERLLATSVARLTPVLIIGFSATCSQVEHDAENDAGFEVLRDVTVVDAYGRRISIDLVLTRQLAKDEIVDLVRRKYQEAVNRKPFEGGVGPTLVYVYLYPSLDHYGAEFRLELAYAKMTPVHDEPEFRFYDEMFSHLWTDSGEKFGLSELERKVFYREYLRVDSKAWDEARRISGQISPDDTIIERQLDLYVTPLLRQYQLDEQAADEIVREGYKKRWPH